MSKADITCQEAAKEARKIGHEKPDVIVGWASWRGMWFIELIYDGDTKAAYGRTLRSCLAKLKKEVSK